jgi:hypothetical protein
VAKPIIGLIPPGGWHYIDGDARITGYNYDDLVASVRNYRAENNLPSGDPVGDINSYICSNWPRNCHGVDMVSVTSVEPLTGSIELMNDVQVWAKNILNSNKPHPLVTDEVAEERAKICRSCPQNINWRAGCNSCIAAADRLCASIRQARETKSTEVLGGCRMLRHDNRTAVFLDKDVLHKTNTLPNTCWLNS